MARLATSHSVTQHCRSAFPNVNSFFSSSFLVSFLENIVEARHEQVEL